MCLYFMQRIQHCTYWQAMYTLCRLSRTRRLTLGICIRFACTSRFLWPHTSRYHTALVNLYGFSLYGAPSDRIDMRFRGLIRSLLAMVKEDIGAREAVGGIHPRRQRRRHPPRRPKVLWRGVERCVVITLVGKWRPKSRKTPRSTANKIFETYTLALRESCKYEQAIN